MARNETFDNIRAAVISNVNTIFDIMQEIVKITVDSVGISELNLDEQTGTYVFNFNEDLRGVIIIDLNVSSISIRIGNRNDNNTFIAEANINCGFEYAERYGKITDKDLKNKISEYFFDISTINKESIAAAKEVPEETVETTTSDGTPVEVVE